MPETGKLFFDTVHWVQCRNEQPFRATIWFAGTPTGIRARIDCPYCGRGYYLRPNGEWYADRPLVFLNDAEVEAAKKKAL